MNAIRTVLVVTPDDELRRSIAFALEAEGLVVLGRAVLPAAPALDDWSGVDCAVVDEDAIRDLKDGWERLSDPSRPVVLLTDRLGPIREADELHVILKPLLGRRLVDAVLDALSRKGNVPLPT